MASETKKKKMTTAEAQTAAVKFAQEYVSEHSMRLGGLPEEQFEKAMDAILKGLVSAWADGFISGGGMR